MARTKNTTTSASKTEQKRTTYSFAVNVTRVDANGNEVLVYRTDPRTYGEGPIVGLKNGLKKELERNPGSSVDKSTLSAFGGTIILANGDKLYCSAVYDASQCPNCGATRDNPHHWCDACSGNVAVDLEAEVQDLVDEF